MRIAILMSIPSPWAREIASGLSSLGHDIKVVDLAHQSHDSTYLSTRADFQDSSVRTFCEKIGGVYRLTSPVPSGLRYLLTARKLKRLLLALDVDLLLTLYGGGNALTAYLSGFRPYAVFAVGSDVLLSTGIRRRLARISLNAATAVFANGTHLGRMTHALAPRASVVPLCHGIDVERFSPGSPPPTPVNIVCTRGFLPIYNNDELVRALALVPETVADYTVTFVAGGPSLGRCIALADRLLTPSRRQRVRFLDGVDHGCLAGVLRSAHVYVSLSRSDGTSTSLLEALACGLAPILSDIPANREWIDSVEANGILVPHDQPSEVATALVRAISDRAWRERVAVHNRGLCVERADIRRQLSLLGVKLEALCR